MERNLTRSHILHTLCSLFSAYLVISSIGLDSAILYLIGLAFVCGLLRDIATSTLQQTSTPEQAAFFHCTNNILTSLPILMLAMLPGSRASLGDSHRNNSTILLLLLSASGIAISHNLKLYLSQHLPQISVASHQFLRRASAAAFSLLLPKYGLFFHRLVPTYPSSQYNIPAILLLGWLASGNGHRNSECPGKSSRSAIFFRNQTIDLGDCSNRGTLLYPKLAQCTNLGHSNDPSSTRHHSRNSDSPAPVSRQKTFTRSEPHRVCAGQRADQSDGIPPCIGQQCGRFVFESFPLVSAT